MIFYFDDGRLSQYPTSIENAEELKHRVYNDEIKCTSCDMSSVKYTKTHQCVYCARRDAVTFYNFHHKTKHVWTDDKGAHFSQPEHNKTPLQINDGEWSEMVRLSQLADSDKVFNVSPDPCLRFGHVGLRRLGKCYACALEKSKPTPRQAAKMVGEKWYIPVEPCIRCNQVAAKSVANGTCSGCVPDELNDNRETPDSILMREQPDMIIDIITADECGMKVFRTGEPCRRGHRGWRYIKIGNCIPCLRGEK